MRQIEWAMWANEQALVSAAGLLVGGIIGVAGQFINWGFAAFVIPASVLLFVLEYPRSKRQKGTTIKRKYQDIISPLHVKLSPVTTNYFARFVIHIVLSVPCCFLLPTLMGGMCLMLAAIIYLVAALQGEEWKSAAEGKAQQDKILATSEPPNRPPPRAPHRLQAQDNGDEGDLYINTSRGGLDRV